MKCLSCKKGEVDMKGKAHNTCNRCGAGHYHDSEKQLVRLVKKDDRIDTKFGTISVLERAKGKIMVLIDDDITATFNEKEFFSDFVW